VTCKINNIFSKFTVAFLLFFTISATTSAQIEYKEVVTTGMGQSYDEALNNALAEAISMVNGKNIQTRTIIQVLGGESIPKENSEVNNILNKIFEEIKSQEGDDKRKVKKEEKKEQKEEKKYSQNYIKDIIDETKGGIKSYKILDKDIDKKGWHKVKVSSEVAIFNIPQEAKRTRIAILPLRLFDVELDQDKLNRIILQELNNYLVQTKKFTVLDRDYIEEIISEKKSILEGKTPAVEMAKIGNEISADFIFVGSIEDFKISQKKTKILSSDKVIIKKIIYANISYRLINVATKQIYFTNTIKYKASIKDDNDVISSVSEHLSAKIGEEILFSLYPVLIEKISNDEIYLGQGGNQFKVNDIYDVFEKGEKIIDSYTNEVIGNTESFKGKIKIIKVTASYSKAVPLQPEKILISNFLPGRFLVRPEIKDQSLSDEEVFKKNKKKIEERIKDRNKDIEDEF